jgi:hypothetical protein
MLNNVIASLKYYIDGCLDIHRLQRYIVPMSKKVRQYKIPLGYICTPYIKGFRTYLLHTTTRCWYMDKRGYMVTVPNVPNCLLPKKDNIHIFEIIVTDSTKIWVLDTLVFNNVDITNTSIHLRYSYIHNILHANNNNKNTYIMENTDITHLQKYHLFSIPPYRTQLLFFRPLYNISYINELSQHATHEICCYALFTPFRHKPCFLNGPFLYIRDHTKFCIRLIQKHKRSDHTSVKNDEEHMLQSPFGAQLHDTILLYAVDTTATNNQTQTTFVIVSSLRNIDDQHRYHEVVSVVWNIPTQQWSITESCSDTTLCDSVEYAQFVCQTISCF